MYSPHGLIDARGGGAAVTISTTSLGGSLYGSCENRAGVKSKIKTIKSENVFLMTPLQ
jgi:hypothetical protein